MVMKNWDKMSRKNTGLSPYVWIVFYILPFYYIFHDTSTFQTVFGITMIISFFICYLLSFVSKGWLIYFWTSVQIAISTVMGLFFGYIYFSLFLAFFIGLLKNKITFFTLYSILIITTFSTVNYGLVTQTHDFITQLPFVLLSLIAVVLLPISTYNKNKEDTLHGQLEVANKRISDLVKQEERQRIARDLHDTLGQKLSLIGLKSDLASKLISKNAKQAQLEIKDIQQTARTALKEVRELVTKMRGTKLQDEILRVKQILKAAQIEFNFEGEPRLLNTSLIAESVVSMCIKEAVTNVVKHSGATTCTISIEPSATVLVVRIQDNGIGGIVNSNDAYRGNGLQGMKERLEFVNGSLDIYSDQGTLIMIKVPNATKKPEKEIEE